MADMVSLGDFFYHNPFNLKWLVVILSNMADIITDQISEPLEHRLGRSAERVREALRAVVNEVPVRVQKPSEFQRVLKLDRSLSSRILRALEYRDPLASLHRMPGPHGIRLLLRAAAKYTEHKELITRAEKALTELEHLVISEVGDWKDLSAALCGWLPDVREPFETANRQAAFKAMSNVRGISAETELSITLMHPNETDPAWIDRACITGLCRMRRLRAGAPMGLLHGHSISPPTGRQRLSLEGQPIDHDHGPGLLKEFSTSPTPKFEVEVDGDTVHYLLQGSGVGLNSMVDLLFADITRSRYPAHSETRKQPASPGAVIDVPVKTLIVDVLVHEDVWKGVEPELRMYDTAGRGLASPTDASRRLDRRDVLESIQNMGTRTSGFRTKEVARYVDMVQHVCDKLGWDSSKFRGYRCRVEYPVYGYQVAVIFEPPTL